MLGTLCVTYLYHLHWPKFHYVSSIFEGGAEADCLRLLVGKLPKNKTGPAQGNTSTSLPLSPHYARVLADLAQERGFDGYLLNFECPLQGGIEQTSALCAWITLLQDELQTKVGQHSEVSWFATF